MNLAILSNLETQMLLAVWSLSWHDGLWADSVQIAAFCREMIQQFDGMENNMNHQKLGDPVERKTVSRGPASFLDNSDSSLYLGDMFISTGQIDPGSVWHRLYNSL